MSGLPREIDCFLRWLEVREEAGGIRQGLADGLRCDAMHSALLLRLLDGKEPLPSPPPKAYSRPWYDVIEEGRAEPHEVWPYPDGKHVVIEQFKWKAVCALGPQDWHVTYGDESTLWRVQYVGMTDGEWPRKKWLLERLSDPEARR